MLSKRLEEALRRCMRLSVEETASSLVGHWFDRELVTWWAVMRNVAVTRGNAVDYRFLVHSCSVVRAWDHVRAALQESGPQTAWETVVV